MAVLVDALPLDIGAPFSSESCKAPLGPIVLTLPDDTTTPDELGPLIIVVLPPVVPPPTGGSGANEEGLKYYPDTREVEVIDKYTPKSTRSRERWS